jgi:hypothetical protein
LTGLEDAEVAVVWEWGVPFIEAGKTYMPVNFIASSLGATVSYDATTKIVTITLKVG